MIKKLYYPLLFLAGLSHISLAQWTPVNGPSAAIVQNIVAAGDTVLAGTPEALFLSTNSGSTWMRAMVGFTQKNINALLINNKKVYAASDQGSSVGGLFVSSNYGNSWTAVTTAFSYSPSCIAIDGPNIFVGTSKGGIYVSTDNGAKFALANTGLGNLKIYALLSKEGTVFAATEEGIYSSSDNGGTWITSSTGIAAKTTMRSFAVSGNKIFASSNYYLYSSIDNGVSWTQLPTTITAINRMAVDGNKVYAAGDGKVFLSTDNATFTQINTGLPTTNCVMNAIAVGKNALFTGIGSASQSAINGGAGVYKSTDGGYKWALSSTGITTKVNTILYNGTSLFVGTNGGAFVSTNAGTSWSEINNGLGRRDIRSLVISGPNLIAGGGSGTFYSNNNGTTWNFMTSSGSPSGGLAVSGTTLYAAEQSGVTKTTDNGATKWTASLSASLVVSIAASGNAVYAGTQSSGVYRTINGGTNWTLANTGMMGSAIFALATNGPDTYAAPAGNGIYYSSDSAATWKAASTGLSAGTSVYSILISGSELFAGSLSGEIFYSNNKGADWINVSSGLTGGTIHSLGTDGTYLYAGAAIDGVFKRELAQIRSAASVPTLPAGLTATAVSENDINLKWTDFASNEDKFTIELSNTLIGPWTEAGEVGTNATTLPLTGLNSETTYLFRIKASNAAGVSTTHLPIAVTTVKTPVTGNESATLNTNLKMYPNPTSGILHIDLGSNGCESVKIFDVLGNQVLTNQEVSANNQLHLEGLSNGIYLIQLRTATGTQAGKVIIE